MDALETRELAPPDGVEVTVPTIPGPMSGHVHCDPEVPQDMSSTRDKVILTTYPEARV